MKALSFPSDRLSFVICLLTLFIGFSGTPVCAQQATASVNGTVSDPSGALVSGANVTLKNLSTNVARAVKTNKDGEYLFTSIPIGTYVLTVEQSGDHTPDQRERSSERLTEGWLNR